MEAGCLLRCLQELHRSSILSEIIQGHTVRHYFLNIHFSVVFPSMAGSSKWSLFLKVSPPKPCILFFPPHSCHILRQYNPPEFHAK